MKQYNVHWCDTNNTGGGCLTVSANSEHDAENQARRILQMGCSVVVVSVYERR